MLVTHACTTRIHLSSHQAVVSIALQAGRLTQAVAEVELVALPVLDRQVALYVVAQADDDRARVATESEQH